MNLASKVETRQGIATTAAGTTTINGDIIDMQNFEGVLLTIKFGIAATGNTIKAQQGAQANMSDAADLAGTLVAVGASDEIVQLELHQPTERFVRMVALRGTLSTIDWGAAQKYGAKRNPVDNNVAGTIASEIHSGPAEGVA